MTGLLIALGVIFLLGIMPVGVGLEYNSDGFFAWLKIGFLSLDVYPNTKKTSKKASKKATKNSESQQGKTAKKGGSLTDFLPLLNIILDFLSECRRKLYVQNLQFHLTLADSDPCDLAVKYGSAWAGLSNAMPLLQRYVKIKERDIQIQCDFTASTSQVEASADVLISLGRLLLISLNHGFRGLKAYLKIMNKTKAVQ